ncbi:hypothetical protein Fot_04062 [Forsythia ovata]|uniref:Uncharacterized protein n=1 Tax=Forsythia ovata TaxID=205694 RepID=A0ABD1XEJ6_9LAMI
MASNSSSWLSNDLKGLIIVSLLLDNDRLHNYRLNTGFTDKKRGDVPLKITSRGHTSHSGASDVYHTGDEGVAFWNILEVLLIGPNSPFSHLFCLLRQWKNNHSFLRACTFSRIKHHSCYFLWYA